MTWKVHQTERDATFFRQSVEHPELGGWVIEIARDTNFDPHKYGLAPVRIYSSSASTDEDLFWPGELVPLVFTLMEEAKVAWGQTSRGSRSETSLPTTTVFGEASVIDPNWSVNIEFDVGRPFNCDEFGDYQEFTGPVVSVAGPDVTGPIRVAIRTARGFIRGQAPEVGLFQDTRVHWQATLRVYRQGATLVHSTSPLPE